MADTKISALAPVTDLLATDELVLARSGATKKIAGAALASELGGGGTELDYAQITADVTITGTAAASAVTVVTGNPVTYDGSAPVIVEFYAAGIQTAASNNSVLLNLWEDSTDLGTAAHYLANALLTSPASFRLRRTPSAGAHTYTVKAWRTTTNGKVLAVAGTYLPAFLRITKA